MELDAEARRAANRCLIVNRGPHQMGIEQVGREMEIISVVERRRRWRIEDKLRILAEIDGCATLTDVARRYGVSRNLL